MTMTKDDYVNRCHFGDVRAVLRQMIADGVKVNCIVTSPPYWGLRSYLPPDHPDKNFELGNEPTIQEFIAKLTEVFMLARDVLADDGTCWINMGDCYATGAGKVNTAPGGGTQGERWAGIRNGHEGKHGDIPGFGPMQQANRMPQPGLKPKDLVGQPWRLAFALQDAGWWLRQDIIWAKPNPMPESVRDRCTKSHEYIFLLSKSEKYWWDFEAFQEPTTGNAHDRSRKDRVSEDHKSMPTDQRNGLRPHLPGNKTHRGTQAYLDGATEHRTKAGLVDYAERQRAKWKTPDGWDTSTGKGGHGLFHSEGREAGHLDYEHKARAAYAGNGVGFGHGYDGPEVERVRDVGAGQSARPRKAVPNTPKAELATPGCKNNESMDAALANVVSMRNRRSVWTIPTQGFDGAHFATFPQALVEPCILAGCPPGGTVLDLFLGSGTTAQVAERLGRNWIGIDLDQRNEALQRERLRQPSLNLEAA